MLTQEQTTPKLRGYQERAVEAIYRYFEKNKGHPLVVMPTGTGKSLTLSAFVKSAIESWPDTRVLVLTHVKELIEQDYAALLRLWPEAPAGIYSAGLKKRNINAQVIFGGIQSIHKHAYKIQRCDIVIIDEAHLLSENDGTMYREFLGQLREINPQLKLLGFTATPFRLDSGPLYGNDKSLFTDVAYNVSLIDMIRQGYLCPLVPKAMATSLDVSNVGTRGGEFIPGQLEKAVDTSETNGAAVQEILQWGQNRRSWLIFCVGVDHAFHIRNLIRDAGIDCETVVGSTPANERSRILDEFKAGKLRALTNANVLTTGFDAPGTDLIALLRPTKSVGLYVQMLGRGTRTFDGKTECLVLDFAKNTERHGPIDLVKATRKKPREDGEVGQAPVKECPNCHSIVHLSLASCPDCGYAFPPSEIKIERRASNAAVLSTQIQPEWLKISGIRYKYHEGRDAKPPTLRVNYTCGLRILSEFLCLEHGGYPQLRASQWWKRHGGVKVPKKVQEALAQVEMLKKPRYILVKPDGKYDRVIDYKFD